MNLVKVLLNRHMRRSKDIKIGKTREADVVALYLGLLVSIFRFIFVVVYLHYLFLGDIDFGPISVQYFTLAPKVCRYYLLRPF